MTRRKPSNAPPDQADMQPAGTETVRDVCYRDMTCRVASAREEDRSVEAVFATEDRVQAYDLRRGERIDEVLLMTGWTPPPGGQISLFDSHPQMIGTPTARDVYGAGRGMAVEGDQLVGRLYFARDAESFGLWQKVRDGFVVDVSIGAVPLETIEVAPGESVTVGDREFRAADSRPLYVRTRWTAVEISLTSRGADRRSKVRDGENSFQENDTMPKKTDTAQAEELQPQDTVVRNEPEPQPTPPAPQDPPPPPTGEDSVVRGAGPGPDAAAAAVQAERARVAAIGELFGADRQAHADLYDQAIRDGWTRGRAADALLAAIRGARSPAVDGRGPAAHTRGQEQDCTIPALAAALMLRQSIPDGKGGDQQLTLDHPAFDSPQARYGTFRTAAPWLALDINDPRRQRAMDLAHRYASMSLLDVCRQAVRLDLSAGVIREAPNEFDRAEVIRAALSGSALNQIFTTNVNAAVLAAYVEAGDSTSGWVAEEDVADFRQNERIAMGKIGALQRLGRGGMAADVDIGDSYEQYRVYRFAGKFTVGEEDIIDDRFGAINATMPGELGNSAAQLRPDMVYALIHANPTLNADSTAVFHSNHANTGTAVFSSANLQAAIAAMAKQRIGTRPLNLKPRFLVIAQDLFFAAEIALTSATRVIASNSEGTANPLQATGIVTRADDRMGAAGCTDPVTGTAYTGLATKWALFARPGEGGAKTIVVGYLRGTGRAPAIRSFTLDRGQWGIGWDIKHDLGAKWMDYRGAYMSTGGG